MKSFTKLLTLTLIITSFLFSCNTTTSKFEGSWEDSKQFSKIIIKKKVFGDYKIAFRAGEKLKEAGKKIGWKENFLNRSRYINCSINNDTLYPYKDTKWEDNFKLTINKMGNLEIIGDTIIYKRIIK